MKENKLTEMEKVSATFAIVGHAIYFTITTPIFILVLSAFGYGLAQNFKLDAFFIVALFAGIFLLLTKISLSYSDVYIEGDTIVLQKLWGIRRSPSQNIRILNKQLFCRILILLNLKMGEKTTFGLRQRRRCNTPSVTTRIRC